jgi:hypothetical protein
VWNVLFNFEEKAVESKALSPEALSEMVKRFRDPATIKSFKTDRAKADGKPTGRYAQGLRDLKLEYISGQVKETYGRLRKLLEDCPIPDKWVARGRKCAKRPRGGAPAAAGQDETLTLPAVPDKCVAQGRKRARRPRGGAPAAAGQDETLTLPDVVHILQQGGAAAGGAAAPAAGVANGPCDTGGNAFAAGPDAPAPAEISATLGRQTLSPVGGEVQCLAAAATSERRTVLPPLAVVMHMVGINPARGWQTLSPVDGQAQRIAAAATSEQRTVHPPFAAVAHMIGISPAAGGTLGQPMHLLLPPLSHE